MPRTLVALLALFLFGPRLAVLAVFLAQNSKHRNAAILQLGTPVLLLEVALFVAFTFVKIPVSADATGVSVARLFRFEWSDVVSAQIRNIFGFAVLEIQRRSSSPWRFWLHLYKELPLFLAAQAPPNHPLTEIGTEREAPH